MADRLALFAPDTVIDLAHYSLINGHHYVVLKEKASSGDRGFFWSPSVEILGDTAPDSAKRSTPSLASVKSAVVSKLPTFDLKGDFASRVVGYMLSKGYNLDSGVQERNIIYLEGVNLDGKENDDRFNQWNDLSILLSFKNNSPYILFKATATTEPGDYYTFRPMNPGGAFRIAFDQFKAAWRAGYHGRDDQWALVQAGEITGYRDFNKDGSRTGDRTDTGSSFAVNHHGSYTSGTVGRSSAGCLVREHRRDHERFMHFLTDARDGDPRYLRDKGYRWDATIIDGSDFAKSKWGYG